jgi:hypothetical protein
LALEVEGDSHLVIIGLQQLLNGVKAENISHNWHMNYGISALGAMVTSLASIVLEQTRRKGNVVVDFMANLGVMMHEKSQTWHPREPLPGKMEEQVQRSCHTDMTTWREVFKHTGRNTLDQGLQHEASKDDRCPKTVMEGIEDERTTLPEEVLHPKLEKEDMWQSRNMHENEDSFKANKNDKK